MKRRVFILEDSDARRRWTAREVQKAVDGELEIIAPSRLAEAVEVLGPLDRVDLMLLDIELWYASTVYDFRDQLVRLVSDSSRILIISGHAKDPRVQEAIRREFGERVEFPGCVQYWDEDGGFALGLIRERLAE